MADSFQDPLAVAHANFYLLRNLIKYLVIEGPMEVERMAALLDGTIVSAEASGDGEAAKVLEGLRADLMRPARPRQG